MPPRRRRSEPLKNVIAARETRAEEGKGKPGEK
jgi:hypothetical protein